MKRLVLLLACAALAFSACSGGSHDAGNAGKTGDGGGRNRVERATTGIGAAGRRTVVVTPPRTREVLGDLRVPALHHRTAIVLVHGGGGFLGDRGEEHAWQDLYSHSGYITLSADYFIFNDNTPPPVYPQPESDVKAAVQYLRRHADDLGIDPQRIVVHGFSAGARIGAQLLVGPDVECLGNLVKRNFQFQPDRYYGGRAGSNDPAVRARWDAANSDARAATATGPVLLFHGDIDPMPVSQSTGFADALRATGHDVDLVVLPGANHGFDIKNGKLTPVGRLSGQRVLRWLEDHFA